jgi:linker histone H1 and H5 family
MNEIEELRDRLHALNCHIQAERNSEVRHALQRGRLEAELLQVVAKLVGAHPAIREEPKRVTVALSSASPPRHKRKPDNLPPTSRMITEALRNSTAVHGLAPAAITAFIRTKYWPDVRTVDVNTVVWRLAQMGRLAKTGSLYRLNGAAH